jgi:hypothetical protein
VRETERKFTLRIGGGFGYGRFGGGIQLQTQQSVDRFRYVLPKGTTARKPRSILWVGEFGEYGLDYRLEGGALTVERRFQLYSQDIPRDRFGAFKRFCKKIDQWEQESVEIKPGK